MTNRIESQLLCTFFELKDRKKILNEILERYVILNDSIYLLKTDDNRHFYSYNVDKKSTFNKKMKRTILVHRKQESNTIFTINSLNELQKKINNGINDVNQPINWEVYKDKILLFSDDVLTINSISLVDVIEIRYLEKKENE